MYHNPVPAPCPVCVVSAGGPSEPPPLDVWSGLMFTVLLTECWRIWADMSPQCSLPACLTVLSHSLSQEISARRLGNGLLLTGLCLAPSFCGRNWHQQKARFSQWSKQCISTVYYKENKEGFIKRLNLCVARNCIDAVGTNIWHKSCILLHNLNAEFDNLIIWMSLSCAGM